MDIRVIGCKDKALETELYSATRFFASELLSKKMIPHISVEIVMKTKIKDLGNCVCTFTNDYYKPREFEIQLRRHRSLANTLKTLAHEMVHLKQFAKDELKVDHSKWKGESIDLEQIEYSDYPWEIEATSLENILYNLYLEHDKQNQI